jgi:hypothetical protein
MCRPLVVLPYRGAARPMAILRHKLFNPARASSCGSGAAAPALLLLLHGTGDNEGGLLPLGGLAPEGAVVASLRAPLQAPFGGFRWFEGYSADPEPVALERTIATSTDAVFDFIEAAPSTLGTDPERVYLLGFSRVPATRTPGRRHSVHIRWISPCLACCSQAGRHGHLGDAAESVASAKLHRRCRCAER